MQRGQQRLKRFFSDKTKHNTPDVPRRISPEVLEFTSDVYTVPKGGTFTLRWKVKDVTSIELHKNGVFENRFNSYETHITKTAFFDLGVKSISYKLVGYKDGEQIESLPVEITLHERKLNGVTRTGPDPSSDSAIPKINGAHVDTVNGENSLPAIFPVPSPNPEHPTEETGPTNRLAAVDPEKNHDPEPLIDAKDQTWPILPIDPLPVMDPVNSINAAHIPQYIQQVDPLQVMEPATSINAEHNNDTVQQVDPLPVVDPVPSIISEHPVEPVESLDPVPLIDPEHQTGRVPSIGADDPAEPVPPTDPSGVTKPVAEILLPTPGDTIVMVDPLNQVESAIDPVEEAPIINRRKSKKSYLIGVTLSIIALVLTGLAFWFYPQPKTEKPVISISGVNPKYIYSLSEPVTITGKHFPANVGKVKVLLNNVPALIKSQSENSLVINFPEAADQTEWKGAIKIGVIINNDTLYTPQNVLVLKNLINTSGENEDNSIPGLRKPDETEPATISDKEKPNSY